MLNNIKFSTDLIGSSSYLVATAAGGNGIIGYQLQMMVNNKISNTLAASRRNSNDDIQIYYNATGKISMSQALARSKISKEMFISFAKTAIATFEELAEYQLASGGLVFNRDYIFYKAGGIKPEFIYLPVTTEDSGFEALKKFLLDMIVHGSMDTVSGSFIQNMLNKLNEKNLSMAEFLKTLESEERGSSTVQPSEKIYAERKNDDRESLRRREIEQDVNDTVPDYNIGRRPVEPAQPPETPHVNIRPAETIQPVQQSNEEIKPTPSKPDKKNVIIFGAVQIVIAAVAAFMFLSGMLYADGALNTTNTAVLIIAGAGIDFVLYRELFVNHKKESGSEAAVQAPAEKSITQSVQTFQPRVQPEPRRDSRPEPKVEQRPQIKPEPKRDYKPVVTAGPNADMFGGFDVDDTVVDFGPASAPGARARLEYVDNGTVVSVYFERSSIIVGRLRNQVDCVLNSKKVGKVHAEFVKRENEYFVKDYNSTNGTFINTVGQRIMPNIEYPIKNGDKIYVADVELTFRK